jgi:tetratricopeptide (TPR) repeat protein
MLTLWLALGAGALWGGLKWWEIRRYRRAMAAIEQEMENGLHGLAARNLATLLDWSPGSDEAAFLLGICEKARGRPAQAAAAWARVPADSSFAPNAILGLLELHMERGRYADAEQFIKGLLENPRIDGSDSGILLVPAYRRQGRLDEAERLIELRWDALNKAGEGASERAINLVRVHINIRGSPVPSEVLRSILDEAARMAPEDDRIWLGKANLAIRTGLYDEAAEWIDACLRRRSDDVAVWRARLEWAVATNHVAAACQALTHLPAERSPPAEVHKLAAWLAAQRGAVESERRALERLIAADPADFAAFDRLAELAARDGRSDAADLRLKKNDMQRILKKYEQLHDRYQLKRDAAMMARLAEQLGRRFEAKAFLTVAVAVAPDREDIRRELAGLDQHSETTVGSGHTLADRLQPELGGNPVRSRPLTPGAGNW